MNYDFRTIKLDMTIREANLILTGLALDLKFNETLGTPRFKEVNKLIKQFKEIIHAHNKLNG